jgi:amino acid adenylation domain-containing protein
MLNERVLPLTPLQSGILFHALREPHGGLYAEQLTCTLDGLLDQPALCEAWQRLVARHDALRTALGRRESAELVQVVHAEARMPLEFMDWSGAAPERQVADLAALQERERLTPFDLFRPPLMRATLVRVGPRRHMLVWTHHHVILDGWSLALLVQDLLALYADLAAGRTSTLAPAGSFEPFVHWLARQDRRATLDYWSACLEGFRTPTLVEPDVEPGGHSGRVDRVTRRMEATQARALQELARARGCTPFTAIAAAWAVVLGDVVASRDVLFGATVSGRPCALADVESMVGLFINTIPFRVSLDADEPLERWLHRLEQHKQTAVDQHAHAPLSEVLKPLRLAQGPARRSPFNTLLVYENYPLPGSFDVSPDLVVRDIRCVEKTNYDLTLVVVPAARFEFTLSFDPGRHSRLGVRRLLGRLLATLERVGSLGAGAAHRVGELREPVGVERHRLLVEYARGTCAQVEAAPADGERLERVIWSRAAQMPESVAVTCGETHWTYAYLRAQAGALARTLGALGVEPDGRVGLCLRRGPWLVAGALGVMEAGAAYVPIDPTWPAERRSWVASDAGLRVVLVDENGPPLAWEVPGLVPLKVGAAPSRALPAPVRVPSPRAHSARQLAYVIYTSGSTGTPKGVMIEHPGALNRLRWMQRAFPLRPGDRVLQKTPVTFDVSVWELFWPLMVGARLVLAEPERHRDTSYLAAELRRRRIGSVHFVPPVLRALLESPGLSACCGSASRRLRHVICSGETLTGDLVSRFWSAARAAGLPAEAEGGVGLFNLYGPTEASVDVSAWSCPAPRIADNRGASPADATRPSVSIGRPIDGIRLYVVDSALRALPAGATGELCIGGVGLARGYLRRPALTAERFMPDPFADETGRRLYRTGDLARWRPDGALDFLGRMDDQVKIRGVRVEPGELEQTLRRHAAVLAAAVVARPHADAGQRLIAYVQRRDRSQPWPACHAELQEWLCQRVPDHLVPAAIVELTEGLPLSSNGKLDRRALPPPDAAAPPPARSWPFATPLSIVEETIAQVWADVLDPAPGRRLTPEDSFFSLGGDSLTSLRAVAHLGARFQVEVPVETLFEAPTLRAAGARVEQLLAGAGLRRAPATPSPDAGAPAELSSAQKRLWIAHQFDPSGVQHNVACAVWLEGPVDERALAAALGALAQRHETLRTEFDQLDGEPVQRVRADAVLALRVEEVAGTAAEFEGRCAALALEQMRTPFDLRQAPVGRATLLRGSQGRSALVLSLHHIACDGWSARILVRDVCVLYEASAAGRQPALGAPSLRYVDFARWQNRLARSSEAQARLARLRARLEGAPSDHGLPVTPTQGATGAAAAVARRLPAPLTMRLRELRRSQGVTSFMLVLSAFKALLHDLTGRTDIVVGTDVADRALSGAWDVVGFFVNQLALRTDLSGDPEFFALLARVRATCVEAYAHQDVPYEELVRQLRPGAKEPRALFQMKVVQQQPVDLSFDLGALRVRPLPVSEASTEFDLILNFAEEADSLSFEAEFRTDRLTSDLVALVLRRLEHVLAAAVDDPSRRLSALGAAARDAEQAAGILPARRRSLAQIRWLHTASVAHE